MTYQNTAAADDMPQFIKGLEDVAALYDGFIFDLWGVVHDGVRPFAGVPEVLAELKRAHRKVWLLSNAPRRSSAVARMLTHMGITEDMYTGITTSGEATWHALADKYIAEWGNKCLHIGMAADQALYDDLPVTVVEDTETANFIVCTGMRDGISDPLHYNDLLRDAAKRGLPMVCANPDRVVHVEDRLIICPGTLADMYIEHGGKVVYFGKPYRDVYHSCLAGMGVEKVLAVGDGMPTDIEGANAAGLACVLITSGIHREEAPQQAGDAATLARFLEPWPFRPQYLLEQLRW